ncbi:MAG: hypothetical protein CMJ92_04105 [Planctomycetes bacterium]|nr:hypothetical protein [Planctomycetota bacterium]
MTKFFTRKNPLSGQKTLWSFCLLLILFLNVPVISAQELFTEVAGTDQRELILRSSSAVSADEDEKGEPSAKDLRKLVQQAAMSGDASALAEVLRTLGRMPGRNATAAILSTASSLSKSQADDIYWFLLQGVAGFKGADAFTEMGEFVVRYKSKPVARDLLNALRKSRSKYVNRVIRRVFEFCPMDMQMMAVDIAAEVPVRRTIDVLMPILAREDAKEKGGKRPSTELKRSLISALEALTMQQLGDSLINWKGWWERERSQGLKVIREDAESHESTTGLARPLDPVRARQFLGLEDLPPGKVLVIKGPRAKNGFDTNYDHIEHVLERISIPHTVIEKGEVEKSSFSFKGVAAVFINCSHIHKFCQNPDHKPGEYTGNRMHRCVGEGAHDEVQFKMNKDAVDKIVRYVETGGYLFTEDWCLIEVLEIGFSRYLRSGSALDGGDFGITPEKGMTSHPLLRGVFVPPVDMSALRRKKYDLDDEDDDDDAKYDPAQEDDPGDVDLDRGKTGVGNSDLDAPEEIEDPDIRLVEHRWKIDKESPSMDIQSKKVQVLIDSEELRKECGEGAVAVTFPVKKGRVIHVLSHFGKQSSSDNEATIENLLINFLLQVRIQADK